MISQALLDWYQPSVRKLPWRETQNPWLVLASEFMLQQTTVQTVQNRFPAWIEQFPTPQHLSQTEESEVLCAWEGLGYYSRARNLHASAKQIVAQNFFPSSVDQLLKLPGVGPYIAHAVACFAFNQPVPLIEANSLRIIARLTNSTQEIDLPRTRLHFEQILTRWLDPKEPAKFHHALMELGQTICLARGIPRCSDCPLAEFCQSKNSHPERLPIKSQKVEKSSITEHCIWALCPSRGLLLSKSMSRRKGFWRLPQRPLIDCQNLNEILRSRHSVTRYNVTQILYLINPKNLIESEEEKWIPLLDLKSLPIASPDRKIISKILS